MRCEAPRSKALMKRVLLLKAPAKDEPDRYEAAFEAKGYTPLSVPVLETVLVHCDVLRDKIVLGPEAQGLSGVIITSRRAVEAWCEALRLIQAAELIQADWRTVPFYIVGDATATAASQICGAYPSMVHLTPLETLIRGGTEAGTAERLAEFILKDSCKGRRLLYLTGDKNRDTLPRILADGSVALESLEVYGTVGSSTFQDDLRAALKRAPVGESHDTTGGGEWAWVVYFAPSAAAFVTPALQDVFCLDAVKVAAIGPTTASFLRDTLKMRVDVVASKPTPDALCGAVVAFDDVGCTS